MTMEIETGFLESKKARIWLQISFWMLYLVTSSFIFFYFLPANWAILRGVVNLIPLMVIFYANNYLVDRFLERRKVLLYFLWALVLFAAMVLLRIQINLLFPLELELEGLYLRKQALAFGALITGFSVQALSFFYQLLVNHQKRDQHRLELIREQQAAQLQFLRAQINPHFLFNTLNNIYALAVVRSEKTADMVLQLSLLLRYVIYESQHETVSLEKEVEHVEKFIHLFEMRSPEALNIRFNKKGGYAQHQIEPMILIPLVENCFKHCDFDTNKDAFVEILLQVSENQLFFKTYNSKSDKDAQKDKTGGVGLDNIRRRLELKHPKGYRLNLQNTADTFTVELVLDLGPSIQNA